VSILSDKEIKALGCNLIYPFIDKQVSSNCVSYGLSSYGYDIRCGNEFKVFCTGKGVIDPKDSRQMVFKEYTREDGDFIVIPANSFALTTSLETVNIPRDVLALCLGKSTYARCGIIVNVTPLEPEWHGIITMEISNTTPLPVRVYAGS